MSEEIKMNLFQKLQEARVRLQDLNVKKSGQNSFAKYSYYELGDILPAINNINRELGLCTQVTFDTENAYLNIYDSDQPEQVITFTSPMAEAQLKGAHPIQNLGATETYQRRYLYMSAYEIVEHDAVDSSKGKAPKKTMNSTTVDYYLNEIEVCDDMESLGDLWENAQDKFIINKDVKGAFTARKKLIAEGMTGSENTDYSEKHG